MHIVLLLGVATVVLCILNHEVKAVTGMRVIWTTFVDSYFNLRPLRKDPLEQEPVCFSSLAVIINDHCPAV